MASLATALANRGCKVRYVAEELMSEDRASQGWKPPKLLGVDVVFAGDERAVCALIDSATSDVVHLCQGFRGNGMVGIAQSQLRARGRAYFVLMETIDQRGLFGWIKPLLYRALLIRSNKNLRGVLAIGERTLPWLRDCGLNGSTGFPFAYFLPLHRSGRVDNHASDLKPRNFKVLYVGRLIRLKRVDLLISCLAALIQRGVGVELHVVGDGPLQQTLRAEAERKSGLEVHWHGVLPMEKCREMMVMADCLVLPSDHDGWGAVVTEALMAGTPAICSDACGAAVAVTASSQGGVFPAGNGAALEALLMDLIKAGKRSPMERERLAAWAECLGAEAGARYLLEILDHVDGSRSRPPPPWARS